LPPSVFIELPQSGDTAKKKHCGMKPVILGTTPKLDCTFAICPCANLIRLAFCLTLLYPGVIRPSL
jgi:hypothetical protein